MGKCNTSDDIEFSQRLLDKYQMFGNIKDLHNKLRVIPDSYEGFVAGVLRYASTSCYRKEKVMNYLEQNPQATCAQVTEYVMKQFDFHDAAKQTELEAKLYKVKDSYSGFVKAVLNYVSRKVGRVQIVLDYLDKNENAQTSDILDFISKQNDFYKDAYVDYNMFFDEFKEECLRYPANYEKIESMLKIAGDINSFPYDEDHNFLSDIIHWSVRTNPCDTCSIVDYDNMSENETDELCDEHEAECENKQQELLISRDGRYVPHIVEMILEHGFDTSDINRLISRTCWMGIVYSTFDKYMLDIAKVLLRYNVEVPQYAYDDTLFIDFLESHESAARVVYKDNEQADTFAKIIELIKNNK